jgi:Cu/Ag efflux protein CusF
MRTISTGAAALLAVLLLGGAATAAEAAAAGKIKSINPEKKQFVLTDEAGKDHTFATDEHTVINPPGAVGKFADLKEGEQVSVVYNKGLTTWTAGYILVHTGDFKKASLTHGTVKSWDAATGMLTVTGGDNKDYTFEVGATARVQLAGKPAKTADLKPGDKVNVVYDREGNKVAARDVFAERP